MTELVANLRAALERAAASTISWMDEATRAQAIAKLDAFDPRLGGPVHYIDYSPIRVDRNDLLGNVMRANDFAWDIRGSGWASPPRDHRSGRPAPSRIFNEDGTVCVVFGGEIYNFQPLMAELARAGPCLSHPVRHRGHRPCLGGMGRGMSRALQRDVRLCPVDDERRETLFLARDRLGEKPLYYSILADGRLLFASELKAIACVPRSTAARPAGDRGVLRLRLYSGSALDLSRRQKTAAGAFSAGAARRDAAANRAPIGSCVSSTAWRSIARRLPKS